MARPSASAVRPFLRRRPRRRPHFRRVALSWRCASAVLSLPRRRLRRRLHCSCCPHGATFRGFSLLPQQLNSDHGEAICLRRPSIPSAAPSAPPSFPSRRPLVALRICRLVSSDAGAPRGAALERSSHHRRRPRAAVLLTIDVALRRRSSSLGSIRAIRSPRAVSYRARLRGGPAPPRRGTFVAQRALERISSLLPFWFVSCLIWHTWRARWSA